MVRTTAPPILAELRSPPSPTAHLLALKNLKNEIIGHDQKKEGWIHLGIIPLLVSTLSPSRFDGKRPSRELNGAIAHSSGSKVVTEEEEVRLQATIIIGSLAQGGPAFVAPLLQASAIPSLLAALATPETPPVLILATLRTLDTIADALALNISGFNLQDGTLSTLLFSDAPIRSLTQILSQSSTSATIQKQISLAASLIGKTCREDWQQTSLANGGILDALATRLAGFVVAMGFVLPGADLAAQQNSLSDPLPPPAPFTADLHPILDAISAIIQDSKLRAAQLLYSPAIPAVFPRTGLGNMPDTTGRNGWTEFGLGGPRPTPVNPIDCLLPQIPTPQPKASSSQTAAFPPLTGPRGNNGARYSAGRIWLSDQSAFDTDPPGRGLPAGAVEEEESPLFAYLLHVTRAEHGLTRLMAASVLTVLYRAGLTSKRRETALALLIVPLLVRMLDEDVAVTDRALKQAAGHEAQMMELTIKERTPALLAMLVTDSLELQKAAVEAHAIKKLSQMLKVAYDPITPLQSSPWTPAGGRDTNSTTSEGSSTSRLGDPGLPAMMIHKMLVRGSALKALAALAPFKDEYRRTIIDNGVTPFLVESLKPFDDDVGTNNATNGDPKSTNGNSSRSTPVGNPPFVLIAACGTVRALSRSVSILRTSLIDAGVAMPLFALLKHPDLEVQVAATAAVCNLVLEFSPMREAIMRAGVLSILCELAHSTNAKLRLNALWALKNLVCSAENDIKMSCLEELGQTWLIQLICDDTEKAALAAANGQENGESAMEVSIDASERDDGPLDIDEVDSAFVSDDQHRDEESRMADSIGALSQPHPDHESNHSTSMRARIPTSVMLHVLREEESNATQKARRDDRAVQEQGLAFIRNLICGPDSVDMIDFLMTNLGQERLFEILSSKLRSKIINPYSRSKRRSSQGSGARVVQPHGEIIVAVCFILVHIAASHPRHRQLLISQTDLLSLLVPLFGHPNKNVRVALTWIIINLTWLDDQADQLACKARALELKSLGFQSKLEALEHDLELDVRERAKTALSQIKQATSS